MYKTSNDRRFRRNKELLRRAFLDLVIERDYRDITVASVTEKADLNRMTFYGHYETIDDIFQEFVDDMEAEISAAISNEPEFNIDGLFSIMNSLMYREIDFFRHTAKAQNGPDFKSAFKNAIARLLSIDEKSGKEMSELQKLIVCDQVAVCIAYTYLDWLAGDYGEATLDEVIELTKELLKGHITWIAYQA